MGIAKLDQKMSPEDLQKLPLPAWCKPKSEKEEKWYRELGEYEFFNQEEPGMLVKFPYGSTKHKTDLMFMHGGKYIVPRFIAQHIENCTIPIWKWRPDGSGSMAKAQEGSKNRFQMRPVFS